MMDFRHADNPEPFTAERARRAAQREKNSPPHAATVIAQGNLFDHLWDHWINVDGDQENAQAWDAVLEALASLRAALAGIRRLRRSTDRYGFTRARCACGWPGSPWGGGRNGDYRSPAQQAVDEFVLHACDGTPAVETACWEVTRSWGSSRPLARREA